MTFLSDLSEVELIVLVTSCVVIVLLLVVIAVCCVKLKQQPLRSVVGPPQIPGNQRRRQSTKASTNTGGDLADYLQNLVDGMEKGRSSGPAAKPYRQPAVRGVGIPVMVSASNAAHHVDSSLATLRGATSIDIPDGLGGSFRVCGEVPELTEEKTSQIHLWREMVSRESGDVLDDPSQQLLFAEGASDGSSDGPSDAAAEANTTRTSGSFRE